MLGFELCKFFVVSTIIDQIQWPFSQSPLSSVPIIICHLLICSMFLLQIEVILKFEEMCLESAKEFAPLFTKVCLCTNYIPWKMIGVAIFSYSLHWTFFSFFLFWLVKCFQILHYLYNEDIVEEDAILSWEDEKKDADESDKVFVNQAQKLIQVSICYLQLFFHTSKTNFMLLASS